MDALNILDVSNLPEAGFKSRSLVWWGIVVMLFIEGTGFAILLTSFFYYRLDLSEWPPTGVEKPGLLLPTLAMAVLILSCIPMYFADKAVAELDQSRTRIWMIVSLAMALLFLGLRIGAWRSLNYRWNSHVYGSVIWFGLWMHTGHILTSIFETGLILVRMYAQPIDAHQRIDVEVDNLYWYFIVAAWIPFYILIYIGPHLGG